MYRQSVPIICFALALVAARSARAEQPYATTVIDFQPAPGQFVNDPLFNDPAAAIGWPIGMDPNIPSNESLVSLGGFGGSLTLAFDHTVLDDPANPFGLDAIVYSNALWVSGNPNRKWAECGVIEISRDTNANELADDPWYLIPGSHIHFEPSQYEWQTWDDNVLDPNYPPLDESWIPPGQSGTWTTEGYHLPPAIFDAIIVENPNGPEAETEAIFGYADFSPTVGLPILAAPNGFYTRPDNPYKVGITPGAGGGDGFDIAWAVDATTWQPANLDGFDFIRITVGVNFVSFNPPLGELSTEIDAVTDVAEGQFGDVANDGDIDGDDFAQMRECFGGVGELIPPSPCRVMDFDQDQDLDLADWYGFQSAFTGP